MPTLNGVDPGEVLAELGFAPVSAVEPLNEGMDTLLWRFEAGDRYVLRLLRREQGEVAAKEAAVMRLLADLGYPVPPVRLLGWWKQRPALVMDLVEGSTFSAALVRRPWSAFTLGLRFGEAQARLHALRPSLERLPEALAHPTRSWIDWSHADETELRARLRALPVRREAVIHLDFHPMNVLTATGTVTAVLDWSHARLGDPRADLARTESILLLTPQAETRLPQLAQRAFVIGWRRGYRRRWGAQTDMPLFRAWAGAAILADLLPHREAGGFPQTFFEDVTRWTERWKRAAGIA